MKLRAEAARNKLINHIEKRGKQPVTVTPRAVRYWWNILNAAVFDGVVTITPTITLVNHRNEYAWAEGTGEDQLIISIHPKFTSRLLFLTVLAHEMVHAWQLQNGFDLNHGDTFWCWKDILHQKGSLHLTRVIHERRLKPKQHDPVRLVANDVNK